MSDVEQANPGEKRVTESVNEVQTEAQAEVTTSPSPAEAAPKRPSRPTKRVDAFAERRAVLKRQKRVAHRRKINASNTSG